MGIAYPGDATSRAVEREQMVRQQIESRGIHDPRVLATMKKVPRHWFVPDEYQNEAYDDEPVLIGYEQTISQPYIVAYMTEVLRLEERDKVLEIGTGSGYQTVVLAELVESVYTVEVIKPLALAAQKRFETLNYRNIHCRIGNGWEGWAEAAPFDKMIVTAAPLKIPPDLIAQLKECGRMIIPVGRQQQELIEGEKRHGILEETRKIAVRFVPFVQSEKDSD